MDPGTGSRHHRRLTNGQDTWSARCAETRTSGAAGGPGKPTESNLDRAPRSDPAHANHGGNIQVLTAPDGWPLWTSPVRPGREHDTTCLRTHCGLLDTLARVRGDLRTLTDLGYEGEAGTVVIAFKKPKNKQLTDQQHLFNRAHNRLRAVGERGNSLLKITFKALRNIRLNPWRIGDIVAAALVVLHLEHARTT